MSGVEQLVKMANDIAAFFRSEPDHALAREGVVQLAQDDPAARA